MKDATVALICLSGNLLCAGTAMSASITGAPGFAWAAWCLASFGFLTVGLVKLRRQRRHGADE